MPLVVLLRLLHFRSCEQILKRVRDSPLDTTTSHTLHLRYTD
jgi:hypothetical protein